MESVVLTGKVWYANAEEKQIGDRTVLSFTLQKSEKGKDGNWENYDVECTAWYKVRDEQKARLVKGARVVVSGRNLKFRHYTNREGEVVVKGILNVTDIMDFAQASTAASTAPAAEEASW